MSQIIEDKNERTVFELGVMMGQRRAFGMVAGRCSAAQAECLRKIRDENLFLPYASSWDEYCTQHLKVSRRTADRVVKQLKESGPLFFEVAVLTGVTYQQYRRIAKSIEPDGIHVGGEVIALIPANTDRAIEAVSRLQAEAEAESGTAGEAAPAVPEQIRALEKRGRQLAEAFRKVGRDAGDIERQWLNGAEIGRAHV